MHCSVSWQYKLPATLQNLSIIYVSEGVFIGHNVHAGEIVLTDLEGVYYTLPDETPPPLKWGTYIVRKGVKYWFRVVWEGMCALYDKHGFHSEPFPLHCQTGGGDVAVLYYNDCQAIVRCLNTLLRIDLNDASI